MYCKLCYVIILFLVCGACTNAAKTPTPTLEPTPIFIEGQSDLPTGKYVFAQSQHMLETSGECPMLRRGDTPHGYIPCIYFRSDGWLYAWGACKSSEGQLLAEDGHSSIKGFLAWEYFYSESRDGYHDHDSDIKVVTTLPSSRSAIPTNVVATLPGGRSAGISANNVPRSAVVIHSINSQGGIVATICDQTRLLEPEQTVTTRIEFDPYPKDQQYHSCHWIMTCRLTNKGLLDDRQIEVTPAPGKLISKYYR